MRTTQTGAVAVLCLRVLGTNHNQVMRGASARFAAYREGTLLPGYKYLRLPHMERQTHSIIPLQTSSKTSQISLTSSRLTGQVLSTTFENRYVGLDPLEVSHFLETLDLTVARLHRRSSLHSQLSTITTPTSSKTTTSTPLYLSNHDS